MRIGILGIGKAGTRHALNAVALKHDVYGWDIKFGSGDAGGTMPWPAGVTPVPSRKDLLQRVDAVVIATPAECHLDDVLECLSQHKHVLVEKPLALARQRRAMQQMVEFNKTSSNPAIIAVGYNLRFHPLVHSMRDMLAFEKTDGRHPFYGSFCCSQYTDSPGPLTNGCLEEWACHEIDLAEHLLGPLRVMDHRVDRFQVELRLTRWDPTLPHCQVQIHSDMLARQPVRRALICTEYMSIDIDLERNPVRNDHYRGELFAFIEACEGAKDTKPLATGEDGILALQIAERASL